MIYSKIIQGSKEINSDGSLIFSIKIRLISK